MVIFAINKCFKLQKDWFKIILHLYKILFFATMFKKKEKKSEISNNIQNFQNKILKINKISPSIIFNILKNGPILLQ